MIKIWIIIGLVDFLFLEDYSYFYHPGYALPRFQTAVFLPPFPPSFVTRSPPFSWQVFAPAGIPQDAPRPGVWLIVFSFFYKFLECHSQILWESFPLQWSLVPFLVVLLEKPWISCSLEVRSLPLIPCSLRLPHILSNPSALLLFTRWYQVLLGRCFEQFFKFLTFVFSRGGSTWKLCSYGSSCISWSYHSSSID